MSHMISRNLIQRVPQSISMVIGFAWIIYSIQFLNNDFFWDLKIYEKAIAIFAQGGNPYQLDGYLSFVYHPLVLRFMALFGNHLAIALISFFLCSTLFYLVSLGKNGNWWLSSFLAFAFCGIGTISIGSGNITVFMHLILLGMLLLNITETGPINPERNWPTIAFFFFVTIFSIVKPYMFGFLLIPLILKTSTYRQRSIWTLGVFSALLLSCIFFFSSIYYNSEFHSFLTAVQKQTLGKRDLGYGVVMFFYDYYISAGHLIYRAFILHFAIIGCIFLAFLYLGYRSNIIKKPEFTLLLYFFICILNPRLKVYDLFPALIALYIFFYSLPQTTFSRWLFLLSYAISLSQFTVAISWIKWGFLSDPLNTFYISIALILLGSLPPLLKFKKQL